MRPVSLALLRMRAEMTGRAAAQTVEAAVSARPMVVTVGSIKGTESIAPVTTAIAATMMG